MGIGGPARYFAVAETVEQMREALIECRRRRLAFMILGKGSNTLFDDRGFNGAVIQNRIDFLESPEEGLFYAGGGFSFSLLGVKTARLGYAGLEFASGIPGSVGGAVFMNAGANGQQTSDTLVSVEFLDEKGEFFCCPKEKLQFAYRSSSFQKRRGAIVGATFSLEKVEGARKRQLEIIAYRKETQPYSEMSAGCIFRNPEEGHAGALIEECGLKGSAVGGAKVSPQHANFIVNASCATAEDVKALIEKVRREVKEKRGVALKSEVRCIPYEF